MFLISGGGISGLLISSLLIKDKICSPENILVVESSNACGGLYSPWNCSDFGKLDKGMHIFYETLIDDIDSIFYNSLPPNEWIVMENNYKDVAGAYFNGKLQINSPYTDLRFFHSRLRDEYFNDFFKNIQRIKDNNEQNHIKDLFSNKNAEEYWEKRFGKKIYQDIFNPICKKLYGANAENLSPNAAYFTKLDRLVLCSSSFVKDISESDFLRKVLAYPEQLEMPFRRDNNQRGLYPKFGMSKVVDALYQNLLNKGVNFRFNSTVKKIKKLDNKFQVIIDKVDTNKISLEADHIFWSGSKLQLAEAFQIEYDFPINVGESNYIFSRINEKDLNMPDLYYFYCFDSNYSAYRVTNISKYSNNIDKEGRILLCLEQHFTEEQRLKYYSNKGFNELFDMEIISQKVETKMIKNYKIPKRIFPRPLLCDDERNLKISELDSFKNIIFSGKNKTLSKTPFFLVDSLKDIHEQYQDLFAK